MYQVIGTRMSRAFRVLWALEEMGLDYTHIPAMPGSTEAKDVNPVGKVPVLVVDGIPITDSMAILTYLTDKHGQLTAPAGTMARARQDSLSHMILDEFDAVLWMASKHSFIFPQERRVPEIKPSLKWEFERAQERLVARMGTGPFLMGAALSVPDILFVHCLGWSIAAKFPPLHPALKAYAKALRARPAYQRAAAL